MDGGTCCTASGGYSGGLNNSSQTTSVYGKNGLCGDGGGYYIGWTSSKYDMSSLLGGLGRVGVAYSGSPSTDTNSHSGGNGGTGGSGGTINVSSTATVYAYNGNIYTDGTAYNDGENQAYIYVQNGIINKRVKTAAGNYNTFFSDLVYISASTVGTLSNWNSGISSKTYKLSDTVSLTFDMSKQGVGSGAGYIEVSNGTYNIDSSMDTAVQSDT